MEEALLVIGILINTYLAMFPIVRINKVFESVEEDATTRYFHELRKKFPHQEGRVSAEAVIAFDYGLPTHYQWELQCNPLILHLGKPEGN